MDPMDYVLHNNPGASNSQYDPVHAVTGSWPAPPLHQPSPNFPWSHHAPPAFHHLLPAPGPGSDPFQFAPNGGIPPPFASFHNVGSANDFPGPMQRQFHSSPYGFAQVSSRGVIPAGPGNDDAFTHQIPRAQPLNFQPSVGPSMPAAGSSEPNNSLPRPPLPMSDLPANGLAHHHNNPPFSLPLPGPENMIHQASMRGGGNFSPASHGHRYSRDGPSPTRSSQSMYRRPHPRSRRSISRTTFSESGMDEEDARRHLWQPDGPLSPEIQDAVLRHAQLTHGHTPKMVASRITLKSMQSVNIDDLEGDDKVCVICYNEFGTESPEGIKEAALRLPKCKHIFGDHCIRKWFENSDNCPYCRDKVHSEPKATVTARAFIHMMRARGAQVDLSESNGSIMQAMASSFVGGPSPPMGANRANSTGGRRSPPDDAAEQQRRTRPRHGSSSAQDSGSPRQPSSLGRSSPTSSVTSRSTVVHTPGSAVPNVPQRTSLPPLPTSTQRRPDESIAGVSTTNGPGLPTVSPPENGRRGGLPQVATSMSPSAPVFHPRGAFSENVSDALFQGARSPLATSPFISNPLRSSNHIAQGGRQEHQDATSTPRLNMSIGSQAGGQVSIGQDINRSRPWERPGR